MNRPIAGWVSLVSLGWLILGCQPMLIKGTQVPDTAKNRAILSTIQTYERTVAAGKWHQLLGLVSKNFHETRGTPDKNDDDYGYDQLRDKLAAFARTKVRVLRFEIQIEKIEHLKPTEAQVYVEKRFAFVYPRGKYRPGFDTGTLPQLMVLEYIQGRWLFKRW